MSEQQQQIEHIIRDNKQQLAQMAEHLHKMKTLTKAQEIIITDLESQVQIHTEELQRHRD